MSPRTWGCLLLTIAGLYDGGLGAIFVFAAPAVFSYFQVPVPSHWGYVHFAVAMLMIFGLMFFIAAANPAGNRNLIGFGMLLKIAYVSVVSYHWMHGDVPSIFKLFLVVDIAWFFVLGWVFYAVGRPVEPAAAAATSQPPKSL